MTVVKIRIGARHTWSECFDNPISITLAGFAVALAVQCTGYAVSAAITAAGDSLAKCLSAVRGKARDASLPLR